MPTSDAITTGLVVLAVLALLFAVSSVRVIAEYERGIRMRFGRVRREPFPPGLMIRLPVVDPLKSVLAIEDVRAAIDQIAQTTLRNVVGQHSLDETLAETDRINADIAHILDRITEEWGVEVTLVELKDIQLPDTMKRAMARQAEAEREKRAKIIAAEGEHLAAGELAAAADVMLEHPLALQLRNLQTLVEISVDKNSTVIFPSPLMSTIAEIGRFLEHAGGNATDIGNLIARASGGHAPAVAEHGGPDGPHRA